MSSLLVFCCYIIFIHHLLPGVEAQKFTYLGCYIDGGVQDRLITGYKEDLHSTNSPDVCGRLCHSKGFAIAAMQYEYECFCGNTRPSFKLKALESDCDKECRGERNKKCGGGLRLSVYKTGLEVLNLVNSEKELEYIGCFIDEDPSTRLLDDYRNNAPDSLTPHYCVGICYRRGHLYAGMQYGKECFCGDKHPLSESKVSDSQCNHTCSGDEGKKCGGDWRLSIYTTSIPDYPVDGKYLGCFIDATEKRVLSGKKFDLLDTNTPRRCANLCLINNYDYAGLQYMSECFCGNNKLPRNSISDEDCTLECPGDSSERCGGNWRIAVYRTGSTSDDAFEFNEPQYLGCFKDKGSHNSRLFKGFMQELSGKLTPELCTDICRSKGFHYSGTQYKLQCFCDNKLPSKDLLLSRDKCNSPCDGDHNLKCGGDWALSVYKTGLKGSIADVESYGGCYADNVEPHRLLKSKKFTLKNKNIIACISQCLFLGHSLAGLEWREECYCGNTDLSSAKKVDESKCYYACPGDNLNKCGGDLNLSVYKTGIKFKNENETKKSFLGCYDSSNKMLNSYKIELQNNSPQLCIGICGALEYKFAGLEFGVQCFCGHHPPSPYVKLKTNSECSKVCPGDASKFCGGDWRMSVYSTHIIAIDDVYKKSNTDDTECGATASIVNGMKSCKNKVVFYETFDKPLSRDVWHHIVKISDLPDDNFVVFSSDEKNSFTGDGKLHIKASLLPDDAVDGSISLIGCTGVIGTVDCFRNATSYMIIPPVVSAALTTENSFYFRYGIVELIAKLPVGDWIIPELYLEPKHRVYGPQFLSGRIIIAMAFGNDNLQTKDGEMIGSNCLESGIIIGDGDTIRKRKVTKCASEGWNKRFHNYTIIWTPDDIQLVVDGEYQPSLMTGLRDKYSKLCSEIGLQYLCSRWTSESNIAPFDKDFYLKFGVTIGGNRVFPDNCTTNNGHIKPWINYETKALYKFWKKSNEWFQTWVEPSLQIESIKITTL